MTHSPVNANLKQLWDWMFAEFKELIILEFKDKTDFQGKTK
jgi:hypothetical protein